MTKPPHQEMYEGLLRDLFERKRITGWHRPRFSWSLGPNGGRRLSISMDADEVSYALLSEISLLLSTTIIDVTHASGQPLSDVTPDLGTGEITLSVRWP